VFLSAIFVCSQSELEHTGKVFPVHPPSILYCTLVAVGSLWPFSLGMSQGLKETPVLHFANYEVANHVSHPDKEKGLTFSCVGKGFQLATLTFFRSCQVCEFTCYQYTSHVPVVWSFMHPKSTQYVHQRSHLHISFCWHLVVICITTQWYSLWFL
jgi:hypothetical protein